VRHRIGLSDEEIGLLAKCVRYYVKREVEGIPVNLRKEPFQLLRLYARLTQRPKHRPRFHSRDARELLEEIKRG